MLSPILLVLGVAAFSLALRSLNSLFLQKAGALGILATSYLAGYFLTGYWWIGAICAFSWLLLPWLEILTRIRKLRLPLEKNLRYKTPPSPEVFPALDEITEEIKEEGFEHVEDAGWDWQDYQQFFRLFYKASDRSQAAICLIDQNDVAFFYMSISSRSKDGKIWTTWNYPFSYSLKLVPNLKINRIRSDQSFLGLYENHRYFLQRNGLPANELEMIAPDQIPMEIQTDLRTQIAHNLSKGVLTPAEEGQIRYSWRGMFYIWFQFLRDLVRLS